MHLNNKAMFSSNNSKKISVLLMLISLFIARLVHAEFIHPGLSHKGSHEATEKIFTDNVASYQKDKHLITRLVLE